MALNLRLFGTELAFKRIRKQEEVVIKKKASTSTAKKTKKMPVLEHRRSLTAEGFKRILKSYHQDQKKESKRK